MFLFASFFAGWGLGNFFIAIVVLAAMVALVYVALQQLGIKIPGWIVHVFWILVVAFVIIAAIRFLERL